jgi:hypothetical protein
MRVSPGARRIGAGLALAAIAALSAAGAYYQIFSTFALYDDEGYLMLSIRHVLDGHRLYDEVQAFAYGPLYYRIGWLIHGPLGVPLTHDAVRITATVYRLLAATLAAGVTFAMTRRATLSGLTLLLATMHLNIVCNEPGHPQEIAAVVLMAIPLVAVGVGARASLRAVACLGLLVATMAMLKINLGVFAGVAVWMAMLSSLPASRLGVLLWLASAALATALPALLMRPGLNRAWVAELAYCATGWILAVAALSTPKRDGGLRSAHLVGLVTACASGVMLILLPSLVRGTSVGTLIDRLIVQPRAIGDVFVINLRVASMVPAAVAGLTLALLAAWGPQAIARWPWAAHAIGPAKLAFGVGTVLAVWWNWPDGLIGLLAPFSWLVLVPGSGPPWPSERRLPRLVLAWLAVLEPLQAYPVSGSQRWLGSLVLVLCGVVCLGDAGDWVMALLPDSGRRPARALAATGVLGLAIALGVSWLRTAESTYRGGVSLALPGAVRIHLPRDQVNQLHMLVQTLRSFCNPIFVYPGFNSLYFWTGQAPPTLDLISHDIRLITGERQDAIAEALAQSRTACFVRHPGLHPPRNPPFDQRMALLFGPGRSTADGNVIRIGMFSIVTRRERIDATRPVRP